MARTRGDEQGRRAGRPVVLTIAGSDSSGGAGIQADLRTLESLGVYTTTVVTAVTAQDTLRVHDVAVLPAALVARQFDAVVGDLPPAAIKIGMLGSRENVDIVAGRLRERAGPPVVLDPVLASTSGAGLLEAEGVSSLRRRLLPRAGVVTPNLREAGVLVDAKVRDVEGMESAARRLHDMGAAHVLVTGGHLTGEEVVDVLWSDGVFHHFSRPRIAGSPRGTGCVLSAAIAGYLALGLEVKDAVSRATALTAAAITGAFFPGAGSVCRPAGN